jgi:hypothetical protein
VLNVKNGRLTSFDVAEKSSNAIVNRLRWKAADSSGRKDAWVAAVVLKVFGGAVHGWRLRVGYIRRWAADYGWKRRSGERKLAGQVGSVSKNMAQPARRNRGGSDI